ncbi:AraC family transcriptional regulator [Salinicola corii]|uniref:AraC family transcriptional regulator n=1 Tax=Salinicola corii TaxID=2606937 RepID=A0A640WAM0_9GAMM|nr:AraC family transcriptional regulator [Salinicola corii]KAA0016416.1 AraC family transcriptional regulator [Salinicola corii]
MKGYSRQRGEMRFWRSGELPFLEARLTREGRGVGYARHSHEAFSIGAVLAGRSLYEYQMPGEPWRAVPVSEGAVVVMNPFEIHACNPIDDTPWSYVMLYADARWLSDLQREAGIGDGGFRPLAMHMTRAPALYRDLLGLCGTLFEDDCPPVVKAAASETFFRRLSTHPGAYRAEPWRDDSALQPVVDFIRGHCTECLPLERIAAEAGLSPAHLVRSFKRQYGITPHAFVTDCRVRHGQAALRAGGAIADVALECRFADQSHFQRTFKRFTAATPDQYRRVGRPQDSRR